MKNHIQYILRFHVMHFSYIEAAKKVHWNLFYYSSLNVNYFLPLLFTNVFSTSSIVFYIFWKSTNHITTNTAAVPNVFLVNHLKTRLSSGGQWLTGRANVVLSSNFLFFISRFHKFAPDITDTLVAFEWHSLLPIFFCKPNLC